MGKKLKTGLKPKKEKIRLFGSGELTGLNGPMLQFNGNREVSVDGCRGVTDYYDNLIRLRLPGGSVTFSGNSLSIEALTDSSAVIRGTICNVEFNIRAAEQ